ncbi:MAG TPA: AAA family ATPase, partial [Isosphaeraceae bacterium]|nr:AAA family ATPase [Isosphaeraceae bacterium]
MVDDTVARLRREVVEPLKRRFVGRDEIVDLIALAVTAGEHLFLHGPPGTAKSALIRQFAVAVRGNYFEYLLTRFSEPNEVFGPIDLVRLREGTVATVTSRMLPEGEFVFLDELFNANSAILNNLLTVLNERVYRRGVEVHQLPLLSLFAASNHLPEDDALRALFDRFLLRSHVDNLNRDQLPRLLNAGWELERAGPLESSVSAADLRALAQQVYNVELIGIAERYADVVSKVRDLGVALSDRRAVKVLKLVAGSALL